MSTFIDFNNSSNEDVSLPMNFDMNVYGSFCTLGFESVHFGGCAFEYELSLRWELQNYNQLFESNDYYTTFIQ